VVCRAKEDDGTCALIHLDLLHVQEEEIEEEREEKLKEQANTKLTQP
jgi:hypothetical protein